MSEQPFVKSPYVAWKLDVLLGFTVIGIIWSWCSFLPVLRAPLAFAGSAFLLLAHLSAPAIVTSQPYLDRGTSTTVAVINGVSILSFVGLTWFGKYPSADGHDTSLAFVCAAAVLMAAHACCARLIWPAKFEVSSNRAGAAALAQSATLGALIAVGPYGLIGIAAVIIGGIFYARRVRAAAKESSS